MFLPTHLTWRYASARCLCFDGLVADVDGGNTTSSRDPDLCRRPELVVGPTPFGVGPAAYEVGPSPATCPACLCIAMCWFTTWTQSASLPVHLHLLSFLVFVIYLLYVSLSYHSYMATGLHSGRDARLFCPSPFSPCLVFNQQSMFLVTYVLFRQLLLRHWIDNTAFIWVIGLSFFYLRQR